MVTLKHGVLVEVNGVNVRNLSILMMMKTGESSAGRRKELQGKTASRHLRRFAEQLRGVAE